MTRHSETMKRQFTKRYPRAVIRPVKAGWYVARILHYPGYSPGKHDVIASGPDYGLVRDLSNAAVVSHRREATA